LASGWTVTRSISPPRADRSYPRPRRVSERPSPHNVHPPRIRLRGDGAQPRMRGPATGRSRAKPGLLQRRDHAALGITQVQCAMPADWRSDVTSSPLRGDRSRSAAVAPRPTRSVSTGTSWPRAPVRFVPSRLRCRNAPPVRRKAERKRRKRPSS